MAMVADLEVEAMEEITITARPRVVTRMGAGSSILNEHHSGTRTQKPRTVRRLGAVLR